MPIAERRMIDETETLGDICLSVAGEKRLLEAAVGSDGLRRHHVNQVTNSGDDVRREGAQDMAVADITDQTSRLSRPSILLGADRPLGQGGRECVNRIRIHEIFRVNGSTWI
jgi:hypothetical protein